MADIYILQLCEASHNGTDRPRYAVKKNDVLLVASVLYSTARELTLALIQDDDHYQEVVDGVIECDLTGKALKARIVELISRLGQR